ncbi:MAG: hypothetical protein GTO45_38465, partial [Candidatus Aminicenantes bacterium]|nr:hypothetical protein [Candidatus Aminicenantes bacterium]NIM84504.1 hypothetical protein [Candidatus Aminicenantes bacterium]NIN24029.1 hypothetical protein [Candidatus Aminicenantes bacterium]NIN47739.1 hypothetical protein [Candidatus Aminicenantes bacterium]NIN90673.1 hypothetical protein [Candidatus Aminicenantes bacterium]
YCLGILDFVFKDDREQKLVQYFRMFLDKIPYIIIEMPRFNKTEIELESHLDKWLYFFKHLEDFEEIPGIL